MMPCADITLQPVFPDDAEALAELRMRAMRPSLEALGRFDPARATQRFLNGFDPTATRAIILDGMRVGVVVVHRTGNQVLLDHLYIEPSAQGRGVGSAVLLAIIAEARQSGIPIRLGALKDSPSNAFYARHGFQLECQDTWDNYYLLVPAPA